MFFCCCCYYASSSWHTAQCVCVHQMLLVRNLHAIRVNPLGLRTIFGRVQLHSYLIMISIWIAWSWPLIAYLYLCIACRSIGHTCRPPLVPLGANTHKGRMLFLSCAESVCLVDRRIIKKKRMHRANWKRIKVKLAPRMRKGRPRMNETKNKKNITHYHRDMRSGGQPQIHITHPIR